MWWRPGLFTCVAALVFPLLAGNVAFAQTVSGSAPDVTLMKDALDMWQLDATLAKLSEADFMKTLAQQDLVESAKLGQTVTFLEEVSLAVDLTRVSFDLKKGDFSSAIVDAAPITASVLCGGGGLGDACALLVTIDTQVAEWANDYATGRFADVEKTLYFAARSANNAPAVIINVPSGTLISVDPSYGYGTLLKKDWAHWLEPTGTYAPSWWNPDWVRATIAEATWEVWGLWDGDVATQYYQTLEPAWQSYTNYLNVLQREESLLLTRFKAAATAGGPIITQQPQAIVAAAGQNVTLSVVVDLNGATGPLTYQWYEVAQPAGQPLSGETTATLTLRNVNLSAAGDYYVVVGNGIAQTQSKTATVSVMSQSSVQKPVFSPAPDAYPLSVTVSIQNATPGALIYYTTDGSTPSTATSLYTGPILLTASTMLQAVVIKDGVVSPVQTGYYTVMTSGTRPEIASVNGGSAVNATGTGQWVTVDGSGFMPNPSVTIANLSARTPATLLGGAASVTFVSSSRIQVNLNLGTQTATWSLFAQNPNGAISDPVTFSAIGTGPSTVSLPAFSPAAGPYPGPLGVQITEATPGAIIRYTTDGTDPDQNSLLYAGPISVGTTTTIKARAFLNGAAPSGVVPATYTISQPQTASLSVTISPPEVVAAGALWRVNGGSWQASGATVSGISVGTTVIDCKPVPGWSTPSPALLTLSAGQAADFTVIYPVGNHPPNAPQVLSPGNGSGSVQRSGLTLFWQGGDPDASDSVDYAVLLGTVPNPGPIVGYGTITGTPASYQIPFTLEAGTTYYWQIVARDNHGAVTKGPVWSFTTAYAVPDLAVSSVTISGVPVPGGTVTVSASVTNVGDFVSDRIAYVRFYLSHTQGAKEIALTGPSGLVPSSLWVYPLNPGQGVTVSAPVTLTGLPAGTSYLDAWLDSGPPSADNEQNLANNLVSIPINYTDKQPPTVSSVALAYPGAIRTGWPNPINYAVQDDVAVKTVDFYYSTDGGQSWASIAQGISPPPPGNLTPFAWTIPTTVPVGSGLLVKVVATDTSGNPGSAIAGPYTVGDGRKPIVTVLYPTNGVVWDMGSTQTIVWQINSPNGIDAVNVQFEHDGQTDGLKIFTRQDPGSYTWSVWNNFSTRTGRIRLDVVDNNGAETIVESAGYFTIRDTSKPPPPPWHLPAAVTSAATGDPAGSGAKIAADPQGTTHLIYDLAHDNATHTISFRYRKLIGGGWSSPQIVSLDVSQIDAEYPTGYGVANFALAADSNGHPHLVWATGAGDVNNDDVFYTEFDGNLWAPVTNISAGITTGSGQAVLTWNPKSNMPQGQTQGATAVLNGKLYALGGNPPNTTYVYDPNTESWSRKADIPPAGVSRGGAAAVNGRIYVIDDVDNVLKIYDATSDSWSTGASIPTARRDPCVVAVGDMVYVIGGGTSANEAYDPASNIWSQRRSMSTSRSLAAAAVVGGKIYVIAGRGDNSWWLSDIEVYDPAADSWTNLPNDAWLNHPPIAGAVAGVVNGKIYLAGGMDYTSNTGTATNGVWEYDPATNTTRPVNPMSAPREFSFGGIVSGNFYVAGGGPLGSQLSSVEMASFSSQPTPTASANPQIAIDGNNTVHVVWEDGESTIPGVGSSGTNNIYYRFKNSQGWSPAIQATSDWARYPSLAVNQAGSVSIVYARDPNLLLYRNLAGGTWLPEVVISTNARSGLGAIACDPSGNPHVAWHQNDPTSGQQQILYEFSTNGVWSPAELVFAAPSAQAPVIALDNQAQVHVIWPDGLAMNIMESTRTAVNQWSLPTQLNLNSQHSGGPSAALSRPTDRLDVVWTASVGGGTADVLYNYASLGANVDVTAPTVSITAPAAGQSVSVGTPFAIQWNATDDTGVTGVGIALSLDDGFSWTQVAANLANSGSFAWQAPIVFTNNAELRITAQDAAGNVGMAIAGPFTLADLTPPTIHVDTPAGGSRLTGNAAVTIDWTASDNVGVTNVMLEYSLDGVTWLSIINGASAVTNYVWAVPGTPTTNLLLRASAFDASGLSTVVTDMPPLTIILPDSPPSVPGQPIPTPSAQFVSAISPVLQWLATDPDGDPLTYIIHFGTTANPPVVATNTQPQFTLGALQAGTTYYWQIEASDGKTGVAGPIWSFTTAPAPLPPVITTASQLTPAMVGVAYAQPIGASGGTPPYTWSVTSGSLPPGLSFDTNIAAVKGTPTAAGQYGFTISASGVDGLTSSQAFQLSVVAAPTKIIVLGGGLTFGPVSVATNAVKWFTIASTGTDPLTVTSITLPDGFSGNWTGLVAAGATQTVAVTFSPTVATNYTGQVMVKSDATGGNNALAISGTGIPSVPGSAARFSDIRLGADGQVEFTLHGAAGGKYKIQISRDLAEWLDFQEVQDSGSGVSISIPGTGGGEANWRFYRAVSE